MKKKKIFPILIATILVAAAAYAIKTYLHSQHYVSTDDAQIDGDVVPVIARASGYVDEIHFKDNEKVGKGQLLVKLDSREYKLKAAQAKAILGSTYAGVGVSRSGLLTVQANIATAEAAIESAKIRLKQASQDFERYKNLYADKTVTTQQYEDAKTAKESAETQLKNAESQYNVVLKQIGASQTQVEASLSNIALRQAELDYANLQLSYTSIHSPVSGVTSKKSVQIGQFVNQGQNLFSVVNDSTIYVTANFKETQIAKMKVGNPVEMKVDAFPDLMINGEMESFSPATGAKFSLLPPDNATGNFVKVVQRIPARIKITSSREVIQKLHLGMNVYVTVKID